MFYVLIKQNAFKSGTFVDILAPCHCEADTYNGLNWRGSSSSWERMYFCPSCFFLFFIYTRSWRLFLQTRGCCTCTMANTQEQEARVSMKVQEMEADSTKGKQYFGWNSFWWPIRPQCQYDLPLPLPAFMSLGLLCATQWPLIKDWVEALRRQWRHSYQIPTSQDSERPPKSSSWMVCHTDIVRHWVYFHLKIIIGALPTNLCTALKAKITVNYLDTW